MFPTYGLGYHHGARVMSWGYGVFGNFGFLNLRQHRYSQSYLQKWLLQVWCRRRCGAEGVVVSEGATCLRLCAGYIHGVDSDGSIRSDIGKKRKFCGLD